MSNIAFFSLVIFTSNVVRREAERFFDVHAELVGEPTKTKEQVSYAIDEYLGMFSDERGALGFVFIPQMLRHFNQLFMEVIKLVDIRRVNPAVIGGELFDRFLGVVEGKRHKGEVIFYLILKYRL